MPELKIVYKKIGTLKRYTKNSRTHSKEQIQQIAASINEFGFTNPILIKKQQIIAGHGRLEAAKLVGLEELPTISLSGLSDDQVKALVIADNQLALNAGWDLDLLKTEIEELKLADFDIDLLGFDDDFIDGLFVTEPNAGLTDPDDIPELPENPVTKTGDVWQLGRHRLVCGSCTEFEVWDKLEIKPGTVCFTSPPYNLGKSMALRGNDSMKSNAYDKHDDDQSDEDYKQLLNDSLNTALSFCESTIFNVQMLAGCKHSLIDWMNENKTRMCDMLTWDKGHAAPAMASGVLTSRFEWLIVYSQKEGAKRTIPLSSWRGTVSNVYCAPRQTSNEFAKEHGATFPVHLPEFIITELMNKSTGVVDCFNGTGTTIIAAEKNGRIGYGIELSEKYCDLTVQRWQEFTGEKAILLSTEQTFEEVKNNAECTEEGPDNK